MSSSSNTSVKSVFEKTVNNFVGSVSSHLSDWLREHKQIEISSEEICTAFNIPFKPITPGLPSAAATQTQMPHIPGYFTGTGSSPRRRTGRGGRQKKVYSSDHPKCIYIYTRGKAEGKQCNMPVLMDGSLGSQHYCKSCLKKASVQSSLKNNSDNTKVTPPIIPGETVPIKENKQETQDELSVVPIEGRSDIYRETGHGFIVMQEEDGNIYVIKIDDDGEWRDLNDSEIDIAQKMGLTIVKDTTSEQKYESVVPDIPQVPVATE